jgi:hypothetical protein
MSAYTPCTGTGEPVTDIRQIRTTQPRFMYLNGKWTGHCLDCGKSVRAILDPGGSRVAPRHKGV